jgi:hypothetical protein
LPAFVSTKWLARINLLIPVLYALAVIDLYAFHGALRQRAPEGMDRLFLFPFFFGYPHILLSLFSFFDADYLRAYRARLLWGLPPILIAVAWLVTRSTELVLAVFTSVSVCHVFAQQTGIARGFTKATPLQFGAWRFLCVVPFSALPFFRLVPQIALPCFVAVASSAIFAIFLLRSASSRSGFWYLFGCQGLVLVTLHLSILNYPLFVVLIPRVVHDLTALYFYAVHDRNRNAFEVRNLLLQPLRGLGQRWTMALPFALGLGAFTLNAFVFRSTMAVLLTLNFVHFYTESFMWRRGAPHRSAVPVRA